MFFFVAGLRKYEQQITNEYTIRQVSNHVTGLVDVFGMQPISAGNIALDCTHAHVM